jgi:Immunity protein Imm1
MRRGHTCRSRLDGGHSGQSVAVAVALTISRWDQEPRDEVTLSPSWGEVERAIRNLDGDSLNDLYLHPNDQVPESYFAVGGGEDGRYLVIICEANERFTEAVSSLADDGTRVSMMCGGQPTSFATRQLVDLEAVLVAAKHFYDSGSASPRVTWEIR